MVNENVLESDFEPLCDGTTRRRSLADLRLLHTLNILSLNVNGLNSAVKRTRVLEYLHRKSISCALIQETHLKQSDVARFQNKYYKLIAFSCAQNKLRGCLSLLKEVKFNN